MSTTGREAATAQQAQIPGITRIDLQRQDLSAPGREVIQNRVELGPEAPAVRHKHPGEEIIYVLEGTLEYSIDGRQPRNYRAGDALMVPAETVHSVRNVGDGPAQESRQDDFRKTGPQQHGADLVQHRPELHVIDVERIVGGVLHEAGDDLCRFDGDLPGREDGGAEHEAERTADGEHDQRHGRPTFRPGVYSRGARTGDHAVTCHAFEYFECRSIANPLINSRIPSSSENAG